MRRKGRPLEGTARTASALAAAALEDADVTSVQSYVGTPRPYNFNGLVRHYFLRQAPNLADLQVNAPAEGRAREQSHAIATPDPRAAARPIAASLGATIQVAEVPPGRRCCRRSSPRSTGRTPASGWRSRGA